MTKCPSCGVESPASAERCVACAAPLPGKRIVTAVLTPPVSEEDVETRMATSDARPFTGPTTGVAPPTGVPHLAAGQTFGQRYQVISLLGTGGMGAVYHVWDSELGMSAALKIIKPDSDPLSAAELERRFKRELVLARQVTHPNVIRIHDLGEFDGTKYITMPFVQGTDLAHLLKKDGKIAVPRALVLARQIAAGLRAAHEVGVVHRDLKPANILIDTNDHAQITDFGIARSTEGGTMATAVGAVIGTLAYMPPEQALGKAVDQRADVYAFGLIVYEMLTGRPAASGAGDSALALLMERARQPPPGLHTVDPSIPEPIERIVTKCLAPDPGGRYQDAAALEAALDRLDINGHEKVVIEPRRQTWPLAVAGLLLVLAIGVAIWNWMRPGPPGAVPARETVSVLVATFDNRANDPVFQGSLEQALTIAIEGASFITTFPRTQAEALIARIRAGSGLNEEGARLVARSEGIKVVLTRSIAPSASGYTLEVKRVDPIDGKVLVVARSDVADKGSVLKGIERIASQLRSGLGDTTPESLRAAAAETVTAGSLEALKSYSQAQDLSSTGREEDSIKYYQAALAHDANFGRAYSGWATALFNLGRRDEAAQVWQKALPQMDRMTEREALRTRGAYYLGPAASYRQAVVQFEELVSKYPADRAGHQNLAIAYFQTLQFAKAMEEARKAAEIYPQNTRARSNYALLAMYASDFATGEREARTVIGQNPAQLKAYLPIAAHAFAAGNLAGTRQAYEQMRQNGGAPGGSLAAHGLADLDAYEGHFGAAAAQLETAIQADRAANNRGAHAAKLLVRADVELSRGQAARAAASAREAVSMIRDESTLVPAALILLNAGRQEEARGLAKELAAQLQPRHRAYAALVEAEIARTNKRYAEAIDHIAKATALADVWLARYVQGVTYVEAGRYPEAQGELQACLTRRGEATAMFFDDMPTLRYLAPLNYWLGRAQDGLGMKSAADHYQRFLALRPETPNDPLVTDARKRANAR